MLQTDWWPVLATFSASLIPGLELRAGIPAGLALGLPTATAILIAVLGNTLQVPVAFWAVGWATRHAQRFGPVARWLAKTEGQVKRYHPLIRRWGWVGLALFVILPLPATGVWGGAVLGRILQMSQFGVLGGIAAGLAVSGVIVGLGFHGAFSLFGFL